MLLEKGMRLPLSVGNLQFSPNVVEAQEASALVAVSASLRLFGGVPKMRRRIRDTARALGFTTALGCAPTTQGAWPLARAAGGTALKAESLERQVAGLSVGTLPPARPYLEWLDGLGCRTLGDVRRLPRLQEGLVRH